MKYSLCIEPVFTDVDIYHRFALARQCGVDAVELWGVEERDVAELARVSDGEGMPIAAISVYDSWKVRLNDRQDRVADNLKRTAEIGRQLKCPACIGLSGDQNACGMGQMMTLVENLRAVAPLLAQSHMQLVVEALNSLVDHKGYFLTSAQMAFDIIGCVHAPSVQMLYDCYHMQIMEGNLIQSIGGNIASIGHIHTAGVPGRHEPYSGEIHYPALIAELEKRNYQGYVGMEFWPTEEPAEAVAKTLRYFRTGEA